VYNRTRAERKNRGFRGRKAGEIKAEREKRGSKLTGHDLRKRKKNLREESTRESIVEKSPERSSK